MDITDNLLKIDLEDQSDSAHLPCVIALDHETKKITQCYSASNEPLTVIMHQYAKSSDCKASKCCGQQRSSLSFQICSLLSKLPLHAFSGSTFVKNNSSTAMELISRNENLKSALYDEGKQCNCDRNWKCKQWLIEGVINICIGILLIALLWIYGPLISSTLLLYMNSGVKSTVLLLNWLMGVPAGLKLNYNLTAFLGRFFLYHIWLWAEYLRLAGQYFNIMFITISFLGLPGGVSLQLALMQDMLKVFLLHIYCYYIYSSRLYSLNRYSLLSLWRLFRGMKWNLLRKRVDHASYDSTQLFVGTLLFAILLFVLPTVFLYYLVFAVLRSFILATHLAVDKVRYILAHSCALFYIPLLAAFEKLFYKNYDGGLCVQSSSADNITILTIRHCTEPQCVNE